MIINSIIAGGGTHGRVLPKDDIWVNYAVSNTNGALTSNTHRLASAGISGIIDVKILNNADYEFGIFAYRVVTTTNNLSYYGMFNGTDFTSSATWLQTAHLQGLNISSSSYNYNRLICRVALRRKSDTSLDIAASEASNVEITVY